jgi:hypothetical protein
MALEFEVSILGNTPYGVRRIARLSTGSFEGPKLKGTVLPGGGGWMLTRRDDVLEIEVRLTLETDDNQQIYMNWKGLRHGPKEVIDRLYRGETADPTSYYFRTTPYLETAAETSGCGRRANRNQPRILQATESIRVLTGHYWNTPIEKLGHRLKSQVGKEQ